MIESKTRSNYQDILKVTALIAMLIDHIGLYLYPDCIWYRVIGRFAMPIFTFYAGYNFKGNIRHIIWICGLALIIIWKFTFDNIISNILISISIGQLYLYYVGKNILSNESVFLRHFLGMIILTPFTYTLCEYGTLTIAFMMIGYIIAHKQEDKGYILLATIALFIFNLLTFDINLISVFVFMIFFTGLASLILSNISHKAMVLINLNIISRNMLYIYVISVLFLTYLITLN